MKRSHSVVLIISLGIYFLLGSIQEQKTELREVTLEHALPSTIQRIITGYVRELAAEILFIRTSVFLGGVKPGVPETTYSDALGYNFEVMTDLYPYFIDSYFFCQGFLPHISLKAAQQTNRILERGIAAYPQDQVLRLYYSTNLFLLMDEPLLASEAFQKASEIEGASPLFAHLAALLAAQGGDIKAGIFSLNALLAKETNESVRQRYQEELEFFSQALNTQRAVNKYITKYGSTPETLALLIPEFIKQITSTTDSFVLQYTPPTIHVKRPDKNKKKEKGIPFI